MICEYFYLKYKYFDFIKFFCVDLHVYFINKSLYTNEFAQYFSKLKMKKNNSKNQYF